MSIITFLRTRLPAARAGRPTGDGPEPELALTAQIRLECEAMARYALQHGLPVHPELIARQLALAPAERPQTPGDYRELAVLHDRLARAVAPATPQGITLLDRRRVQTQGLAWLGPVPLIRMLTLAAAGFLVAVVLTGLSSDVTEDNVARGLLDASGATLLLNTLFILCCAGLGAAYATLFHAYRYIDDCTYDPKYDASYGARLILGVIAGLILVEMLPARLFEGSMHSFGKPTLAMLGGFSASAVHRMLQRLVETLETLVRGDPAKQYQAALALQKVQTASERAQSKNDLAADLLDLQQSLDAEPPIAEVRERLARLTRAMLVSDGGANTGEAPRT